MRVLILNNGVPFIQGGAELLADALARELRSRGHEAEVIRLPFRWESPLEVADSMFFARTIDLREVDRVIALKFPAYLVPHPETVVWLLHQFRQVYDLWDTPWGPPVDDQAWKDLKAAITFSDTAALSSARKLFTNDNVTQQRLREHNGLDARVLYPPLPDEGSIPVSDVQGDYVLSIGRVSAGKRALLAVQAMAHVTTPVRLIVAGQPDDPALAEAIRRTVEENDLGDRVELRLSFVETETKRELIASSLAVAYFPLDEDSFGYVTAEAMTAGRPVVTLEDSGGILNLVTDGVTGIVSRADPLDIARAFDRIWENRQLAASMGRAALEAVAELNLSWDHVIQELLS
ncbi:glycosyltransferase family 4 protein [Cellulomonas chengniuliangii]|uniref:Glycosyltransferase family 4 protein n=1 Tax=Cellulomonas chengniuliangii TaxID=2968084 RepID=A0ABY5KYL9_9CELL|nr:glycosyltransferase family 4 protein [Cellulomonas chengniuliangii]MCC2310059.1 glycosyltransferase family 4 protein [Cellulomonas chengniuliangii]UUI74546.1 glycosyltransferase family 4 protein [Cellulomonas chengniuliangii]